MSTGSTYDRRWDNIGMTESVLQRAYEAMRFAGLHATQATIAKAAKISQASVNDWHRGYPSIPSAVAFCEKTKVSIHWFLMGDGPMVPPEALPTELREIAASWPRLDEKAKAEIVSYARGVIAYARSTAFTGDPERLQAAERGIEQYQAKNHKKPPQRPSSRRKPTPKKK